MIDPGISALDTLYGRRALAGNVGGLEREQETWTADWTTAAVREAFGGSIHLDPCGASSYDSEVILRETKNRPEIRNPTTGGWYADVTLVKPGTHEGLVQSPHGGTVVCLDGLAQDWTAARSVFLNPEFNNLRPWLEKAAATGDAGVPTILLGPVRPHRSWWPALAFSGTVIYLNYNYKFKGHKDACPFPLCLIAWNCTVPDLGSRETWRSKL